MSENVVIEGNHAAAYFTLPTSKIVGNKDFNFTVSIIESEHNIQQFLAVTLPITRT